MQWTFPKAMQRTGYQTAIIGKWHLRSEPTGFEHWCVLPGQGSYYNPDFKTPDGQVRVEGYVTDIIVDMTLEWLDKKRDKSKPFLMMCQNKAPHRPWLPDIKHFNFLDNVSIPEPDTLFDDYSGRSPAAAEQEMSIKDHMQMGYDLKVLDVSKDIDSAPWEHFKRMTPKQKQIWNKEITSRENAFHNANLKAKEKTKKKKNQKGKLIGKRPLLIPY